jgi:hypothetical protein
VHIGDYTHNWDKTWKLIFTCIYQKSNITHIKCLWAKFLVAVLMKLVPRANAIKWYTINSTFWSHKLLCKLFIKVIMQVLTYLFVVSVH